MNNIEFDIDTVNVITNLALQIYQLFEKGYTQEQLINLWQSIVTATNTNFNKLNADIEKKEVTQP